MFTQEVSMCTHFNNKSKRHDISLDGWCPFGISVVRDMNLVKRKRNRIYFLYGTLNIPIIIIYFLFTLAHSDEFLICFYAS